MPMDKDKREIKSHIYFVKLEESLTGPIGQAKIRLALELNPLVGGCMLLKEHLELWSVSQRINQSPVPYVLGLR
jgi:hypothetical protein